MMKKIMFLMVMALMPMVFSSCGSDDDDNGAQVNKIVGVWEETDFWDSDDKCFRDWWNIGYVHVFKSDGTYARYHNSTHYDRGESDKQGTYSFDGTYLVIDGGFKRKVTFSENGNSFEWEQTAIVVRY